MVVPQNGFHGLVGLATARAAAKRVPQNGVRAFAPAVVLGAMLPDADLYPTAVAFLAGRKDLIYEIHRTLTHSALLVGLLLLLALLSRSPAWRFGFLGFALGTATHEFLDVFFWFQGIDLLWPLSPIHIGGYLVGEPNLWANVQVSDLLRNIREACEFLAFGLMLTALGRILRNARLFVFSKIAFALFLATLITAYAFRDKPYIQNVIVETPYLLFFAPLIWWTVWKHRDEITDWCLARKQQIN
jgi:hypothetical protein